MPTNTHENKRDICFSGHEFGRFALVWSEAKTFAHDKPSLSASAKLLLSQTLQFFLKLARNELPLSLVRDCKDLKSFGQFVSLGPKPGPLARHTLCMYAGLVLLSLKRGLHNKAVLARIMDFQLKLLVSDRFCS